MASRRIYLDYNATAPARPEARDAFAAAVDGGGNPSSIHAEGRGARGLLEEARWQVAGLVEGRAEQICFTSGGTEAANLALSPLRLGSGAIIDRLCVGATEHAAVLKGHRFSPDRVEVLAVDHAGVVELEGLEAALKRAPPSIVAIQAANNETGVIQPVRSVADIVHDHGGILICDAVQAAGRIPCGRDLGVDILLLSGHKLGGLPGAGAVILFRDDVQLEPLIRGGGQERALRGGTENVPAIAAFGAAAAASAVHPGAQRLSELRDLFERELRSLAPDVVIFGAAQARLPNTSAFSVPGVAAERLMIALDLGGVAVSSGSACSSGKVGRSHVLEAMGIAHDLREGAIRVSLGWRSTEADIVGAIEVLGTALDRMKRPPVQCAA